MVSLGGVAVAGGGGAALAEPRRRLPGGLAGLLLLPHLVEDVRVAVRRRRVRVPVAEPRHRRPPRRCLVAARGAAAAALGAGVGDEAAAVAAAPAVGVGVQRRRRRRVLDAVRRPAAAACPPASSSCRRRLATTSGVAVVRRAAGVGGWRRRRRRVARGALVVGRRRRRGSARRWRGDGGGEGLRVVDGVVGVEHLAGGGDLALARVLEVDGVRHVAAIVPVAEFRHVRVLLLLLRHGRRGDRSIDQTR